MKLLKLTIFILACIATNTYAQTPYFYYYKGEKQYLELNTKHIFVSVSDTTQKITLDKIIQLPFRVDITQEIELETYHKRFWTTLSIEDSLSKELYLAKLLEIKNTRNEIIVAPYFKKQSHDIIGLSNFFYVQLKSLHDTTLLKQEVEKENATVVYQNRFMPLWFVVSVTERSRFNAMEAANYFYESGLFQAAEPDLMVDAAIHISNDSDMMEFTMDDRTNNNCANDLHFEMQWNLRNTGQYDGTTGVDIKACEAWGISTGSGVVVAVVDHGIKLNHLDLQANIHPLTYDSEKDTAQDILYGPHGTSCAGIIGAVRNNSIGIAGVAPDCTLMSISNSLANTILSAEERANGINWAWRNGADVISNSWKAIEVNQIDEAIDSAITYGRGGRGCVVVFSAGNYSINWNTTALIYPAYLPSVIAVGAISPCGERKFGYKKTTGPGEEDNIRSDSSCDGENNWASCYGSGLDVMAPGVKIQTSNITGGYISNFNGTSAACPHVAGIAALILSVNPELSQTQIRQIIESTCTKLAGYDTIVYNYGHNAAHPHGTWNNEMGHGLVNAHAAVLKAIKKAQCRDTLLPAVSGIITQNTTWNTPLQAVGNIVIPNNVTLTITNQVKCDYDVSITIHPGGTLILNGGTLTNACPDAMWQGITVMGDPTQPLSSSLQSHVKLENNAKIENATIGIYAVNGGTIYTNNAHFINNTIAVQIEPVTTAQTGYSAIFHNTQFVIDNAYLENTLDFDAHLKLSGCGEVLVSGSKFFNNATNKSYETGKNTGIWAFNTPLSLQRLMQDPVFSGFNVAIAVNNAGTSPKVSIKSGNFSNNLYGINLSAVNYAQITRNEFDQSLSGAYGLTVLNSTGYLITENNFKRLNTAPQTTGIKIANSGSDENEVYKNNFNNLDVGILTIGKNSSQSVGDTVTIGDTIIHNKGTVITGLQFLCNIFSATSWADISVGDDTQAITGFHSVRKNQG
ncbi:MAG: S8 family serine peptidase, partial [Lentimicrobiaceae bacterium]|nr:S8 family serine peptidase [Lentimicrobiaceae bacterium]